MWKSILVVFVLLLAGCGGLSSTLSTIRDVAHTLCMLAAPERDEVSRKTKDDDSWCVEHAVEYVDEVTRAKAAADKRARLGK